MADPSPRHCLALAGLALALGRMAALHAAAGGDARRLDEAKFQGGVAIRWLGKALRHA